MTLRALSLQLCILGSTAGCISFDLTQCADGWICNEGFVCHPGGGGCVLGELVSACAGKGTGERCEASVGVGTCLDGVCNAASCGDGVIDMGEECDLGAANGDAPNALCRVGCVLAECGDGVVDDQRGEVCDDGNRVEGDGCRSDCGSTEVCGNTVTDFVVGELCDDGARQPGDGCSATCTTEVPLWIQRTFVQPPIVGPTVFDPARGRVVLFTVTGETHEWDGVGWRRLRPRVAPLARTDMSLAYDPVRRVVVLFGGERPNRLAKNDLWEWDGFDWRERVTPLAPSPRKGAGFAYDPHRKEMLLFGGFQQLGVANVWVYFEDTWSWNGERWEQLAPTTVPEARSFSLMTTDPARGEILLYGGGARKDHPDPDIGIRDYAFDDTWNWDGSNWVLRDAGGSCFFPCSASFGGVQRGGLFDRGSQAVVRIPDSNPGPTRAWNGTQWTIIPNVQSVRRTMIDPVTGNAVIDSQATGLHRLVSGVWEPLQPPQVPGARSDYGLASWTRRGRVVMSGGTNASLRLSDTWEWDGHQWKRMADAPVAGASVLVEDPIDGVMAILPGDRTFRYSQNGWQELQASPPDYDGVTMAYDRRRNVVVLYRVGVGFVDGETWEWDGMTWLQRSASPPHRRGVSLAYDEQRGRVVMVGGAPNIFVYTDEVWEWDGASWIPLAPFAISRTGAAMAHDRDRGRLILFGGTVGAFSGEFGVSVGTLGDTWERDENGMWRVLDIELAPPHRFARAVEDVRGGVLLFGGEQYLGTATYWNDTWRFGYGPDSNACASGIDVGRGAGCADPGCWHLCSPTCAPGQACPMSEPQCGNLVRDPLETCRTCPGDVGACTLADAVCGDTICDPGEATTCPGDC